jgi:hypothetical protein
MSFLVQPAAHLSAQHANYQQRTRLLIIINGTIAYSYRVTQLSTLPSEQNRFNILPDDKHLQQL